jgi:hypothetical protein
MLLVTSSGSFDLFLQQRYCALPFFEVHTLTSDDASASAASPEEKEEKLVNLARC